MHYAEEDIDALKLKVGDTFDYSGIKHTVEYAETGEPLLRTTKEPLPFIVVSFYNTCHKRYQVAGDMSGDWSGCVPCAYTLQAALIIELRRLDEAQYMK